MEQFIKRFIALLCAFFSPLMAGENPQILIKLNVQGEPDHLFHVLDAYYLNLSRQIPYHILVSYDSDAQKLEDPAIKDRLKSYQHLTVLPSSGKTKVEAYNQGISDLISQYDVVFVSSDAIEPAIHGYDKMIADAILKNAKDQDAVLNIVPDGKESVNAAPAIGKKFYQRFGYVYNPAYKNSCYDHELTYISRILGKETILAPGILKTTNAPQAAMDPSDVDLFQQRRLKTFELDENELKKAYPKDWSILICTLNERQKQFDAIYEKLQKQIKDNKLEDKVEVLFFRDNREHTVGFKRNTLIKQSHGQYVNFIDDDDDIHDNYISMIYDKLKSNPDCVSLVGVITFNDQNPTQFIHSNKFKAYFQSNGIYFRPPNHLNTMKRSVAAQFLFPEISFGEDTDWAMRISRAGLLQKEEQITTPYYFYKYVDKK